MARIALLLTVLGLTASAHARDSTVDSALRELSSPYEEVRRRAVVRQARAGPEARDSLLRLYPTADFRTKALVLDVFGEGADAAGAELLFRDLVTEDLGVRSAQRGLLSALSGAVRDLVARDLAPMLRDDWRREEAVRTLPARASYARGVLEDLARAPDPRLRSGALRVAARISALDDVRDRLATVAAKGGEEEKLRACALLLHLARHDVERGLLAVHEAASEGYYDGMYARLAEIVAESGSPAEYLRILGHVIRDEPCPEAGVPGTPGGRYGNLEPVPRDLGRFGVRQVAAQALGDMEEVDPDLATELAQWLRESRPDYGGIEGFAFTLALSLAARDETGPIRAAIADFRDRLESRRPGRWADIEWERLTMRLAGCYGRLGRHREAAELYRAFLRDSGQRAPVARYNLACALARDGQPEAALEELSRAVTDGYGRDPSQITWLERDGDLDSLRELPGYARLLRAAKLR